MKQGDKNMARPKKEFNQQLFEQLCAMQCTKSEICSCLNVDDKTLTAMVKRTYKENFSDVYKQKTEVGKMSLRRMQYKLAERNAGMAIFLGKQFLNQHDVYQVEDTSAIDRLDKILGSLKETAGDETATEENEIQETKETDDEGES